MWKSIKEFALGIHAANAIRHGVRPPAAVRRVRVEPKPGCGSPK